MIHRYVSLWPAQLVLLVLLRRVCVRVAHDMISIYLMPDLYATQDFYVRPKTRSDPCRWWWSCWPYHHCGSAPISIILLRDPNWTAFFFFLYLFNPESDRVPCLQIIVCTSCIYNNRLGRYRESKSFNLDLKITQLVIINDEEQQLHRNIRDNTYMLSYYYWKLESVGNNIVFLFAPAE